MTTLEELAGIRAARIELAARERRLIAQARAEGASWGQIAVAAGLRSRQAAEQRFLRLSGGRRQRAVDTATGPEVAELRSAARELRSGLTATGATPAVGLALATLDVAIGAPPGALYDLAVAACADLAAESLTAEAAAARDRIEALTRAGSTSKT